MTNIVSEQSLSINSKWQEVEEISKQGFSFKEGTGDQVPLSADEKDRLESFRRFLKLKDILIDNL